MKKQNLKLAILTGLFAASFGAQAQQSTAYQINREHTGESIWDTPPSLPLLEKWSVSLPDKLSYPIIADNRIFVLSRSIHGEYGTTMFSIDPTDGHRVWQRPIPGTFFWSAMTYGDGRIYVVNFDGRLSAINPADGGLIWSRQMKGQYGFSAAPTFSNGTVYVSGAGTGGTMYAVDAATGRTNWSAFVENGDQSSPTVTDNAVYASYAGNQAYRFNAVTGALIWHHQGPVEGGGGKTTLLTKYGLYVRDNYDGNRALNPLNGNSLFTFESTTMPAASGKLRFDMLNGQLSAVDQVTGRSAWTFVGDGTLKTAPIVVNSYVIVGGSSGMLYVVKKFSGQVAWSTNVGFEINRPDEQNVSQPLTGLAAGEGLIVVPAGNHLIAYSN